MSTLEPLGESKIPQTPEQKPAYELTMAVYNEEKGLWEAAEAVGEKTKAFIEDAAVQDLLAHRPTGDVLEFTEEGIYKRTEQGWVKEISSEEAEQKFPNIQRSLKRLSLLSILLKEETAEEKIGQQSVSPDFLKTTRQEVISKKQGVVQIIVKPPREDVSSLTKNLEGKHPDLAHYIQEQNKQFEAVQTRYLEMMRQESIEPDAYRELLQMLRSQEKQFDTAVNAGKATLLADHRLEEIKKAPPPPKLIGKGKAKKINFREEMPESAYITPVSGTIEALFGSKEAEIRREVATTKKIVSNLYKSDLLRLLEANKVANAKEIVAKVTAKYSSFADLWDALMLREVKEFATFVGVTESEVTQLSSFIPAMQKEAAKAGHLAIDMQEVTGEEQIEGKYTVRTAVAKGDLEGEIRKPETTFEERMGYLSDCWLGMEELHRSGYVHGDLKPENLLVYETREHPIKITKHVKLADFGKTRPLLAEEQVFYTGNPRFSPPEKKLSQKGEVYGAAMIAIRILEEEYLSGDKKMLLEPVVKDIIMPTESRQGIERFAVLNKKMPQTESSLAGKVRAYGPSFFAPSINLKEAEGEMHAYINALTDKLENHMRPEQRAKLNSLLKEMTRSDPSKRPFMVEVNKRYQEITA